MYRECFYRSSVFTYYAQQYYSKRQCPNLVPHYVFFVFGQGNLEKSILIYTTGRKLIMTHIFVTR